jgi:RimJ/RimL family protein N-acetyltransferase
MIVRPVRKDEWRRVRELRLAALADTPMAFLETLAAARTKSDAEWQAGVSRDTEGSVSTKLVAVDDDSWVGTMGACVDAPGRSQLVAVWVAPQARGTAVAASLLEAVVAWARGVAGCGRLHLWVHEENTRAQAF